MTHESRKFRSALGRFATGVIVVTGLMGKNKPVGATINAFSSLSLDPPLLLFCLADNSSCLKAFTEGANFVINVLGIDQKNFAEAFATHRKDKFKDIPYTVWASGCPILPNCLANLECTRLTVHEGGDHFIIVGRVDRMAVTGTGDPLLFYHGSYSRIGGKIHDPITRG